LQNPPRLRARDSRRLDLRPIPTPPTSLSTDERNRVLELLIEETTCTAQEAVLFLLLLPTTTTSNDVEIWQPPMARSERTRQRFQHVHRQLKMYRG
jgi:hypothetical protein